MFSQEQIGQMNAKLSINDVRQRTQGSGKVDYIEGYTAIEAANQIFGYGNWSGVIVDLQQVVCQEKTKEGSKTIGWEVGYTCHYKLVVFNHDHSQHVTIEDVGYGSGISYNGLGAAIESATKEAITDGLKRCLRMFGNQFGLALYDKERKNVDDGRFDPDTARRALLKLENTTIDDVRASMDMNTREQLTALYKEVQARQPEQVPVEA